MEKFAVMLQPDNGKRVLRCHPLIKRLPEKIAIRCLPYLPAQKTGLISDAESHEDLGYLIDVPGFFSDWNNRIKEDRLKTVRRLACSLEKLKTPILSFPLVSQYLNEEERLLFENAGIVLLDGFYHRMAGLLLTARQLLLIMEKELPIFDIGIWGADTDVGQVWVEALAGKVNQMCIGGQDYRKLEELAAFILKITGLSCQVTVKPELCLANKNITVLAAPVTLPLTKSYPGICFNSIAWQFPGIAETGEISYLGQSNQIEMGWMSSPKDLISDQELNAYEQLGVLEGLFFCVSSVYRDDILKKRITLDRMKLLHTLYELYPIKLQGFVQNGRQIHYDRFRREYFANSGLDKNRYYNYNSNIRKLEDESGSTAN